MAREHGTDETVVDVEGRHLRLRRLEKVLYPATGTTKAEVLAYVTAVAPALLAQLHQRPLTRKRYPDGVTGGSFFEKNVPRGVPDWIRTVEIEVPGSTKDRETVRYPLLDDLAGLVWLVNLAALELHVPQWRVGPRGGVRDPDRLVVDLDPGEGAGLAECAEVAVAVRDRLAEDGLRCHPVTSGSKGVQLYAAVSGRQDADVLRSYAHRIAEEMERERPRLVVSRMTKRLRGGKVLLDWSQNNSAKTTVAPYSPRGRHRPCAAAPRTWAELDDPGSLRQLTLEEVAARYARDGDLLAPLAEPGPRVPTR
ncbi:non-homologous end-joining DNA ligase [Kineococcus rhizosphaerae]|uniref:Bifunctional non-homologous end joining protein LigD n=1 Tax=Kineococcus rhizosphaerae TaxID=559628 RepID=A0A2T0R6C0_9ACTN|nr:non-homologous end-joining DNA ligase [Kineococcus rhizosphaerae]PRY16688.1 bifunctional non-homologous end joining protein LigD [Kineococcus rhizosphaerae]